MKNAVSRCWGPHGLRRRAIRGLPTHCTLKPEHGNIIQSASLKPDDQPIGARAWLNYSKIDASPQRLPLLQTPRWGIKHNGEKTCRLSAP